MNHFHFSIGPVQSFIAQARRTRDLWTGSFLLSYLSGVAMAAVRAQDPGATIVFPKPVDGVMKRLCPDWAEGTALGDDDPLLRQGGIPNRFMAEVGDGFEGAAVAAAVRAVFAALAERVWEQDLAWLSRDFRRTRPIWDRQVAGFWEIAWVLDAEPARRRPLLDARKNWRAHFTSTEPGVKCTVMDGWQELSGAAAPQGDEARRLNGFWLALHERVSERHTNDLQPGEYLSAIAWIKRRLARVFRDFAVTVDAGKGKRMGIMGWRLSGNAPSVVHIAAAPWLAHTIGCLQRDPAALAAAETLVNGVAKYQRARFGDKEPLTKGESETQIRCIDAAIGALEASQACAQKLRACDAGLFFKESLVNANVFPGAPDATKHIAQALGELCSLAGRAPSSFYALLRMDGDRIGEKIAKPDWRPRIANALNRFTRQAVELTAAHSGFLIYAGGDDVLALFPVDHALTASAALAGAFHEAMEVEAQGSAAGEALPTLSGAIVFAHIRMPLSSVVLASDRLLTDVAKDQAGRNALAVQVIKPGGPVCEWAAHWSAAAEGTKPAIEHLQALAAKETAVFSNGFLNRLRALHEQQVIDGTNFHEATTFSLLLAELVGTRRADRQEWDPQQAQQQLENLRPLLAVPGSRWAWQADAAVLVRFLAQKGSI